MFYPLAKKLVQRDILAWPSSVSASNFKRIYVQCVTSDMKPKFLIIYGRLYLDFLLRSALFLFSFEFRSFSRRLLFIVVTILIKSWEFGQV